MYAACFAAYIVGLIGEAVVTVVGMRAWCACRGLICYPFLEVQSIIMWAGAAVGATCSVPPLGYYLTITI